MAQRWTEKRASNAVFVRPKGNLPLKPGFDLRIFQNCSLQVERPGIFMTVFYLEALAAIAVSLAVLMALAWVVQQRTGNSGWVDSIRTFLLGLVGAGSRDDQSRTSPFFPLPPHKGAAT
jgi:hypothetical protein